MIDKKKNTESAMVAFIVVCWNNKSLMKGCLESIQKQVDVNVKIIVVDNASKDGSAEYISSHFPDVELLIQSKNYAFAKGNNIGIDHALNDPAVTHIALLNSDATLDENWTSVVVEAARMHPKSATLQSVTLDFYDHQIIDSTHIYIAHNSQATQGSWRLPIQDGTTVSTQKVFGCNAAAMLITREFIEAQPFTDFFDETMFMYLEDVDVATRATVMGWDNYVVSGTFAYHMGSASSSKNPSFSLYMTFRNNIGLLIKNLPAKQLLKTLLQIPLADRASIKHLKRTGRSDAVSAVYKGRLVSILYIPTFIRKRRKLKKLWNIDRQYLWNLMRKGI